jgi:hypothetical protein
MRRDAGLFVGHVIVQEGHMLHGNWPQASISNMGPMNGRMEHHHSGNCHDGLDFPFGNGTFLISSRSRETNESPVQNWQVPK